MGGGYNRNTAKLILAEVEREHGPEAVAQLIRTLNQFKPGCDSRVNDQTTKLECGEHLRRIHGAIVTLMCLHGN